MKLIIDIPDDVIAEKSYCKYFGCFSTKFLEIIENSISVNTDGDLISRSALKEEIIKKRGLSWESMKHLFCITGEELDNAPTVSDRYGEGYAQGYIDGSTGADWKGGAE